MKNNTLCFALSLAALSLAGCTLESVPNGIECPNMKYVKIDANTKCMNADECSQYPDIFDETALKAIRFGLCPPDPTHFDCKVVSEDESYCNYIDRSSEVICNNKAIIPTSDSNYCGARGNCNSDDETSSDWHGQKCEGSSRCEKGKCVRESVCGEGTHADMYNQCVPDTGEDCGSAHDNCETDGKLCYNGICLEVCPDDTIECGAFESVRGICVKPDTNTAYCGAKPAETKGICTGYETCGQNQTCTDGHCHCKPGYHEVNTGERESYCVMDTKEECGNPNTHKIENCYTLPNASEVYCDPNRGCVIQFCADNYHLYEDENICEADDEQNCGRHGNSCAVENANNSCVNRYCNFECNEGFVRDSTNTQCVSEGVESCGTPPVNCTTRIDGWKSGACQNGHCTVTACQAGYHLHDNSCEENTNDHCGDHQTKCAVAHAQNTCTQEGKCEFTCDDDYRKSTSGDSCVSNSTVTCGANNVNCAETVDGWANGKCEGDICVASECINNYYPSGGKCAKSDDSHCGSASNNCLITHGTGKCVNNQCQRSCDNGYHLTTEENACEENTVQNCGSTGYVCSVEFPNWSNGSCSTDGKCIVSKCTGNNHVYADRNECEENTITNCGEHGKACPNESNGSYTCPSGECVLSCDANYHLSYDKKRCTLDRIDECGNSRTNCQSLEGWEAGSCTGGRCVATSCTNYTYLSGGECHTCEVGYHLNTSATGCEEDSAKACGKYRKDCTLLDGWGSGECKEGICNATYCFSWYNSYTELHHETTWCYGDNHCSQYVQSETAIISCPFMSKEHDHICCDYVEDCAILFTEYESAPDDAQIAENHCEPIP